MKEGLMPQEAGQRIVTRRRNNAPIRPPRPATSVPDVLFALASAAWTMAAVFFVASFFDDDVTSGAAGQTLARLFAGSLVVTGAFVFLLGFALMRDDRGQADHYIFPLLLGVVIGLLEAWLFLLPAANFLLAPFLLLILVIRPVRRQVSRLLPVRGLAK